MIAIFFLLIQIILWVICGAFFAFVVILPIFLMMGAWELVARATINNIFNGLNKIPIIGTLIAGPICTVIGITMIVFGFTIWANYLFIFLRCIGGGKI